MHTYTSLQYEPTSEPLRISIEVLMGSCFIENLLVRLDDDEVDRPRAMGV